LVYLSGYGPGYEAPEYRVIRVEVPKNQMSKIKFSRGAGLGGWVYKGKLPKKWLKEDVPATIGHSEDGLEEQAYSAGAPG
jgi:hypothetical protein